MDQACQQGHAKIQQDPAPSFNLCCLCVAFFFFLLLLLLVLTRSRGFLAPGDCFTIPFHPLLPARCAFVLVLSSLTSSLNVRECVGPQRMRESASASSRYVEFVAWEAIAISIAQRSMSRRQPCIRGGKRSGIGPTEREGIASKKAKELGSGGCCTSRAQRYALLCRCPTRPSTWNES